jgi:hypothetical protein
LWKDNTPMARWEWVRWVNATNNPNARKRRVEVTISKMNNGNEDCAVSTLRAGTDPELSRNGGSFIQPRPAQVNLPPNGHATFIGSADVERGSSFSPSSNLVRSEEDQRGVKKTTAETPFAPPGG